MLYHISSDLQKDLIRQPCVEEMCYRDVGDGFEFCEHARELTGAQMGPCVDMVTMPGSETMSEFGSFIVCQTYAYPESWKRGCPKCTLKFKMPKPEKGKKVNPLKASKRGLK